MIRLTKTYAKIVDSITIQEAPEEHDGVTGFKYDAKKCIEAGYFPVKFTTKSGNTAIYQLLNGEITQIWVDIDSDLYSLRVVELIRARYSENEELAILRKTLSGIDNKSFDEYNLFCEVCKKQAKLEQLNL